MAAVLSSEPGNEARLPDRREAVGLARSRQAGEHYERAGTELDTGRRRIFAGSRDNGMYALQAQDGAVLWRFETLGPVQSEPCYDSKEDALYFGSNDGALYKVNATTGSLLWRF